MMRLYEINDCYLGLLERITDCEDPQERIALEQERDQLADSFEDKAVQTVAYIKNNEATANAIGEKIKELQAKQKRHKVAVESNKLYLLEQLKRHGYEPAGKRITKSPYYDIGLKFNPVSVDILDESQVPSEYTIIEKSWNKQQMLFEMKNGVVINGAALKKGISLKIT